MQQTEAARAVTEQRFARGDPVVYLTTKQSVHPGPRAQHIAPASKGDQYSYTVKKFWRIVDVLRDGTLVAATRRGKRHLLTADDPKLRTVSWWEKLAYRSRFPSNT